MKINRKGFTAKLAEACKVARCRWFEVIHVKHMDYILCPKKLGTTWTNKG